jgi:hypothetical protein
VRASAQRTIFGKKNPALFTFWILLSYLLSCAIHHKRNKRKGKYIMVDQAQLLGDKTQRLDGNIHGGSRMLVME